MDSAMAASEVALTEITLEHSEAEPIAAET